eukprot:g6135.t1
MFEIKENEKRRLGTLFGDIPTPAFMVTTKGGVPSYLTPDLLKRSVGRGCLFSIDLSSLLLHEEKLVQKLGVHDFFGFREDCHRVFLAGCNIVDQPILDQNSDKSHRIASSVGVRKLNPQKHFHEMAALRPDCFESLADTIPMEISSVRKKRCAASVDRTLKWLDCCLEARRKAIKDEEGGWAASSNVLAVIVGGVHNDLRLRSVEETAKRADEIAGVVISSASCFCGDPKELGKMLATCVEPLPANIVRIIRGMFCPSEALAAVVDGGIDVVESNYPIFLTKSGRAMTVPLPTDKIEAKATVKGEPLSINLYDLCYERDMRPLVPGCGCYACERHSRAYIHHLLRTHEMLGAVLLEMHNIYRYKGMFISLREAMKKGPEDVSKFRRMYLE